MSALHSKSNGGTGKKNLTLQFNAVNRLSNQMPHNHLHLAPFRRFLISHVEIIYTVLVFVVFIFILSK